MIITVNPNKVIKLKNFVNLLIKEKQKETHHQIDKYQEYKRFYTGLLGEAALEELLNINIIDWEIGDSRNYNKADLSKQNLNIGIKTVEYGKFPIIHKNSIRPEIINVKINDTDIFICGLASIKVLLEYQEEHLILSPFLKEKGTKTGFYGFNKLIKFNNLNELKNIYEKI
jgi:hypothetical protein